MPAGYSGTPLLKKLGIKPDYALIIWQQPEHYFDLLGELPAGCSLLDESAAESADFIHLFCKQRDELIQQAPIAKAALKKTGMLWVSWPKGSSDIPTDLKRDPIRTYLLGLGLVDTKVAAVDDDWSGLKFVYRVKDR